MIWELPSCVPGMKLAQVHPTLPPSFLPSKSTISKENKHEAKVKYSVINLTITLYSRCHQKGMKEPLKSLFYFCIKLAIVIIQIFLTFLSFSFLPLFLLPSYQWIFTEAWGPGIVLAAGGVEWKEINKTPAFMELIFLSINKQQTENPMHKGILDGILDHKQYLMR